MGALLYGSGIATGRYMNRDNKVNAGYVKPELADYDVRRNQQMDEPSRVYEATSTWSLPAPNTSLDSTAGFESARSSPFGPARHDLNQDIDAVRSAERALMRKELAIDPGKISYI
jgi:hypothetical protein